MDVEAAGDGDSVSALETVAAGGTGAGAVGATGAVAADCGRGSGRAGGVVGAAVEDAADV